MLAQVLDMLGGQFNPALAGELEIPIPVHGCAVTPAQAVPPQGVHQHAQVVLHEPKDAGPCRVVRQTPKATAVVRARDTHRADGTLCCRVAQRLRVAVSRADRAHGYHLWSAISGPSSWAVAGQGICTICRSVPEGRGRTGILSSRSSILLSFMLPQRSVSAARTAGRHGLSQSQDSSSSSVSIHRPAGLDGSSSFMVVVQKKRDQSPR